MIPTRTSRPFGRISPRVSDVDLARLIDRTIEMRVKAKREQGFAAFSTGCDGRRRTTMFDGSVCQAEGEVCIATRQDGISACIETPTQGNGLTTQSVTFAAAVCSPVTGWWIVDAEGYMYRVPQALIDAAAYWPLTEAGTPSAVALARSKTWAALMCGAALSIPLNGEGGGEWTLGGGDNTIWTQYFDSLIGRGFSYWTSLPSVSVVGSDVTLTGGAYRFAGIDIADASALASYGQQDAAAVTLSPGEEYYGRLAYDGDGLLAGYGLIGEGPMPYQDGTIPFATVRVQYGADPEVIVTATTDGRYTAPAAIPPTSAEFGLIGPYGWRGILLRDAMSPNAGSRVATVTLPTAGAGVVTGPVRVAYGYPFGYRIDEMGLEGPSTLAPYPRSNVVGTWQADTVGRIAGDMALCYSRRLAVEYGSGHVCLDGDAITDAGDYVPIGEMDLSAGPPQDVAAGVIGTPGGEVVLLGPADIRSGQRYRVRPAPDAPVTVSIEQQAKGIWGADPNLWTEETTYNVAAWLAGATSFTVDASIAGATGPGRGIPVVLWETDDSSDTYLTAPVTYAGTLGETSGGLTPISFASPVAASSLADRYLTVVGIKARATWGWTFEVGGIESALSLLTGETGYSLEPPSVLYSAKITVPGGPVGTTVRRVYRFAYDYGSSITGIVAPIGPWAYLSNTGGGLGGVYDRHCRLVKTLTATIPEPGTDPVTFYDEDLSLATSGTRPPTPLIYTGSITVEAPRQVHLLQPINL